MKLTETTVSKNYVFKGRIINVRNDDALLPNGKPCKREVVEHNGGACVLAVDSENYCYLVRQFRYPYGEELLEIPAGKLEVGEDPKVCAIRELAEEAGLLATELTPLCKMYPSPGYTSEVIHIFTATDFSVCDTNPDDDEFLNLVKIPLAQAITMALDGTIKDAKTLIALLKYNA